MQGFSWGEYYRRDPVYQIMLDHGDSLGRWRSQVKPPGLDDWLKLVIVTLNAMWLEGTSEWFNESCYGSDQALT